MGILGIVWVTLAACIYFVGWGVFVGIMARGDRTDRLIVAPLMLFWLLAGFTILVQLGVIK